MKHITLIAFIITLCLILVACQGEAEPTAIPEPVEEAATAAPEPTTEPTAEPAAEAVDEGVPPQPTDRPVVEPPTAEEAGVLPTDHFYIDATGLAANWGHTIDQGTTLDLNYPPGNNGIPPHNVVSFGGPDERADQPSSFNLFEAQGRILPVEAYINMYEAAGSDSIITQVETLTAILEERPETIEGRIPVLPDIPANQVVSGKTSYSDFNGGSGVGFVASYSQDASPIFNDKLSYLFQGLTDDGQHWVSFVWPLTVNFLPSLEEATQDYQDKAHNDSAAYREEVNQLVNEAADSDFDPVLVAMNQMMQSMIIGEAAQAEKPPSPNIFSLKWQWEQFQDQAEVNDITVSNPENYELILWTDGTFNFKADCNVGSGSYTMNGSSLSLEPGPITLAECGPDSLYDQFLNQLGYVATYVTNEGKLILNLFADAGDMVFVSGGPVPYAELVEYGRAGSVDPMDPDSVSIDMMDLADSWGAHLAPAGPYDASMPPGPMGVPEHIQIHFDGASPGNPDYSGPILYVIPVEAYKRMWDEADNPSVSTNLDNLESILKDRPDLSTVGASILPYEVWQYITPGGTGLGWQRSYLDTPWGSAIRSVARPSQSIDVITNQRLTYVEQGLTDDGLYLVSFFYPVRTDALPDTSSDVPQEELDQVNSGDQAQYEAYRQAKQEQLDGLSTSDWQPDLTALDEVINSLQFGDYGR
jgi:heat shock protein HslJ